MGKLRLRLLQRFLGPFSIFDIDEDCLPTGSAILAETALRFLKGQVKL